MPHDLSNDYIYDEAGRLIQLAHATASNTIASYSYALDNVGNRRTLTESVVTNIKTPQGAYLEQDGLVTFEAERYGDYLSGTSHSWVFTSTLEGYHHPGYLHATPDLDALYQTQTLTDSPTLDYLIHFTTPGTYTLWARAYADNGDADSLHLALDQQPLRLSGFSPEAWSWSNQAMAQPTYPLTVTIESSGLHTLTVWMREDGLRLDRLLLTTDPTFIPTDLGPDPTVRQRTETIIHYDYDPLYRLTNADYSTGETYEYTYDPVGNRLQQIIDGDTTSYLYDDANRLASVDGTPYTFDANGNLLNSDTMTNTWDAANRLTQTERNDNIVQPIYNGINDRVGQIISGTQTDFALDIIGLPEVIQTSEGNSYLHLPGVIMTESSAGETRYLLSDGLGSVRQVLDESGAVVAYNEFDPYGNPVQNDSSPYGYTGEWWQDDIGLLHLRARWYAPEMGTFLSVDAVESEPPYQYVQGNVVNWIDPSGNSPNCSDECEQLSQPSDMHEKARISCFELSQMGAIDAMERYLRKESLFDPAATLTRVAMSENTDNLDDQKLVMWIIRYRMAIAHSEGWHGYADKNRPTNIWTEVYNGGFEAFDIIKNVTEPEKTTSNIMVAIYPHNTTLDDDAITVNRWIRAYSAAQSIWVADLETGFPQELIVNKGEDKNNNFKYAFDSFIGDGLSAPGDRYSKQAYSHGNNYFAFNPLRSQWIWPEWNEEWPDWE